MFDLIIAYLVIMFLVNTAKSAKEQQKKGAENQKRAASGKPTGKYAPYGNKRLPTKKQPAPAPERPAVRTVQTDGPAAVWSEASKTKSHPQPMASQGNPRTKPVKQPAPITPMAIVSEEEERLQEILTTSEENILTGMVWSEILGPPVCKRSRRC